MPGKRPSKYAGIRSSDRTVRASQKASGFCSTGVIGRRLAPLLTDSGHEVIGLARSGADRAVDVLDRDAVVAARKAFGGWSGATAYNRGQVLYRVAEMLEGRRAQFVAEVRDSGAADAESEVDAAIDRWVWYAGWSDKVTAVLGAVNPVAGPYFDFSLPEHQADRHWERLFDTAEENERKEAKK